ncbi:hypothetical protein [Streptomyces sp. NPDC058953]|uniref:hypothetical protein n=1 Tax=unclassified Streptomyces TaxID=2593676 RepID=UPI0036A96372
MTTATTNPAPAGKTTGSTGTTGAAGATGVFGATGWAAFPLFRIVVLADACSTAVFGLLLLASAIWLDEPLGLPSAWSVPFGLGMLAGAATLAVIGLVPRVTRALSGVTWIINGCCALALLALVVTGIMPLTTAGTVVMLVGVAIVASFASLQFAGHRLARSTA